MSESKKYDPCTDDVLFDLTNNTIVDVNVALAKQLNFTLKNGEVHTDSLDLLADKSADAACDSFLVVK